MPPDSAIPERHTLLEYAELLSEEFESQGWYVRIEPDLFSVSRFFKNGRPRRTPTAAIRYFEYDVEIYFDASGEECRRVFKRDRPWRVEGPRLKTAKTYSRIDKAMDAFVAEVRAADAAS